MFYSLRENRNRSEKINNFQDNRTDYKCVLYCDPLHVYGGLSFIPWADFYLGKIESEGETFIFTSFDLSIKEFSEVFNVSEMIPTHFRHILGNKVKIREFKKK